MTADSQFVFVGLDATEWDLIPSRHDFSLEADDEMHDSGNFEQQYSFPHNETLGGLYKADEEYAGTHG